MSDPIMVGTAKYWDNGYDRLISMQAILDAGIHIDNPPDGIDPADVYVHTHVDIEAEIHRRLAERGKSPDPTMMLAETMTITEHTGTCPYCSNPEGWDACPVHRDGPPNPSQ